MNNNQILSASLNDIIFDGRNKEYGAYELRTGYAKRILKALSVATIMVTGFVFLTAFRSKDDDRHISEPSTLLTITTTIIPPEVKPPEPVFIQRTDAPAVKSTKYVTIKIVPDDEAHSKVPDQDEIKDTRIDLSDRDGPDDTKIAIPIDADSDGKGIIENIKRDDEDDAILGNVEIEASVRGGLNAWLKYLERNLRADIPVDNNAPEGTYTVIVQFVVSKDGKISDVRALTAHGFGMEAEAIRVIKNGPEWNPAVQNGRNVNAYRRQPVTFRVEER